ncbi:MAG: VanZ family protein, partial [Kovacikia sp.]
MKKNIRKLIRHADLGVTVCSFLVILIATLYPFNFSIQEDSFFHQLVNSLKEPSNLIDQLANVLLFIPLGFGLNWFLTKRTRLKTFSSFALVLVTSFGLSLSIELLQTFLPARTSSLSDVLTNTMGGVFGYLSFNGWQGEFGSQVYGFLQSSLRKLTVKKLAKGFVAYFLFVFLITVGSQNIVNLTAWDTNFSLLIGNEKTGDRPWKGTISELAISNNVISEKDVSQLLEEKRISSSLGDFLLARYAFQGNGPYPDVTGNNPDLTWRGTAQNSSSSSGVLLSPQAWLETKSPAEEINQQIRKMSQFTLNLRVASGDQLQSGPARIFSLSQDPLNRNLTIGQEGQDLTVRLRTLLSGPNGANPQVFVGKVFADDDAHHIVITYSNAVLRVYVDAVQNVQTFDLSPDATFLSYLLPPKIHSGRAVEVMHTLLTFTPLAFLLALIITFLRGNLIFYCVVMVAGGLLPPLLLEMFWASRSYQSIRLENLLFSISIFFVTFLITRLL